MDQGSDGCFSPQSVVGLDGLRGRLHMDLDAEVLQSTQGAVGYPEATHLALREHNHSGAMVEELLDIRGLDAR